MLFRVKDGEYKWFKVKTRHLSSKAEDLYTIAVLMDLADEERAMELEYMRKTDFYEALLSETIAYAEVDVESEKVMQSGGRSIASSAGRTGIHIKTALIFIT